MTERHRAVRLALAGLFTVGVALSWAGPASADPTDPSVPTVEMPPPADPALAPPPAPVRAVPEIPNPQYGSGQGGGGVLGTLMDLWDQVKNPTYGQDDLEAPKPPPGAGPAPALPPGYVSINAPGSETPGSPNGGAGPATGRPALPPGYYSIDGPPPPGYQFNSGSAPAGLVGPAGPAVPVGPTVVTPVPSP